MSYCINSEDDLLNLDKNIIYNILDINKTLKHIELQKFKIYVNTLSINIINDINNLSKFIYFDKIKTLNINFRINIDTIDSKYFYNFLNLKKISFDSLIIPVDPELFIKDLNILINNIKFCKMLKYLDINTNHGLPISFSHIQPFEEIEYYTHHGLPISFSHIQPFEEIEYYRKLEHILKPYFKNKNFIYDDFFKYNNLRSISINNNCYKNLGISINYSDNKCIHGFIILKSYKQLYKNIKNLNNKLKSITVLTNQITILHENIKIIHKNNNFDNVYNISNLYKIYDNSKYKLIKDENMKQLLISYKLIKQNMTLQKLIRDIIH